MHRDYEVKCVTFGWGHIKYRTYAVVNKQTGSIVGDSKVNYAFDQNTEGLAKARSIVAELNKKK